MRPGVHESSRLAIWGRFKSTFLVVSARVWYLGIQRSNRWQSDRGIESYKVDMPNTYSTLVPGSSWGLLGRLRNG
jgi:hypothetical protein